jgi:hypothetical protein
MAIGRLAAPVLLLALAGCGLYGGEAPPVAPPPNTVERGSVAGGRFISLVGPRRQFAPAFLGVPGTNYNLLRSWIDTRTGEQVTQLYVEDSYSGSERTYEAAHDGDGQALKFVAVSRNEIACDHGCSYAEEFAADLPQTLLEAHRRGLTVIFTAKSGPALSIAVPGDSIDKQLGAIAAARSTLPAVARQ